MIIGAVLGLMADLGRPWNLPVPIIYSFGGPFHGVLAEWDTKGLSGLYAVQLLVVRTDQKVDTAVIQVTISD